MTCSKSRRQQTATMDSPGTIVQLPFKPDRREVSEMMHAFLGVCAFGGCGLFVLGLGITPFVLLAWLVTHW